MNNAIPECSRESLLMIELWKLYNRKITVFFCQNISQTDSALMASGYKDAE